MRFEKDILYPGRWHLPDGREVEFSAADVRHLGDRMRDMLSAGVPIALAWEHQAEAIPDTPERWDQLKKQACEFALGGAATAELDPTGFLKGEVEVPNKQDQERLPAVRFVSPEIRRDWKDGRGRMWPGLSIVGLAATRRPVQYPQQPFRAVSLSQVGDVPIRLSLDGYQGTKMDDPARPEPTPATPAAAKTPVPPKGDLGGLLTSLKDPAIGLVLPGDTTADNLVERLMTACLTKIEGAKAQKPQEPYPGTAKPEPEGARPMTMSTTQTPAPATPDPVTLSLTNRTAALERRLLTSETASLTTRIRSLFTTGRVAKPVQDGLLADLAKQPLKMSQDGELELSPVAIKVEAYEALEPGTAHAASLSQGNGSPVPRPEWHTSGAPQTPAQVNATVDSIDKMLGR